MPTPVKFDPLAGRFSFGLSHLVFAMVFVIRLWALVRLTHSPLLLPTRGDMHFYDDWAREILRGHIVQPLAFYGLPGYAYLLAFLYRILGENPFVPGLLQAALDAGTAVLIYQICLRVFSQAARPVAIKLRAVGLIAGLGWAFFVPAEAYAVVLMPTAWFVFVFWFVVWRIVRNDSSPGPLECLLLGALMGLTATGVATILAILPLLLAALLLKSKSPTAYWHRLAAQFCAVTIGIVIGTSPCWIHNYFVAKDPVFLSAHSGINFWIGNNPHANGYPSFPPGLRAGQAAMLEDSITQAEAAGGRALKHAEVSAYWSNKAKTYISHHFGDWLGLIVQKIRNFCSAFQYDDLSIITNLREQGVIPPGLYFGIVAAFALPGILLGWWLAPRSRWVVAAILLVLAALLPVFITERYRLVAVPGLLIFAAFGLLIFWQAIRTSRSRSALVYLLLLSGSTIAVAWPQRDPGLWALDLYNSGWQALESGNLALADKKLLLAHAYVPSNPETNFALGNLRLAQGQPEIAAYLYKVTLQFDRQHRGALNNLGVVALEQNDYKAAEDWFHQAEHIDPRNAKIHFLLAKALLARGHRDEAKVEIDTAIQLRPEQNEFTQLRKEIETDSTRP